MLQLDSTELPVHYASNPLKHPEWKVHRCSFLIAAEQPNGEDRTAGALSAFGFSLQSFCHLTRCLPANRICYVWSVPLSRQIRILRHTRKLAFLCHFALRSEVPLKKIGSLGGHLGNSSGRLCSPVRADGMFNFTLMKTRLWMLDVQSVYCPAMC